MKRVSLYIPCYNAEKYIAECLEGILRQRYPIDEILVIDDGSTDRTFEIASKYLVRIIRHEKNKGLAAARNTAFKSARNEYVAALDSDCVPEPDWLEKLMDNFTDDNIAGVGGKAIEKDRSNLVNIYKAKYSSQNHGESRKEVTNFLFGLDNVFRRSVIFDVGLFDERFKTNGEDVDVCLRLHKKGYKLIYEPKAFVYHMRKDNLLSYLRAVKRSFIYGQIGYLKNYSNHFWPIIACWMISKKCITAVAKDFLRPHFIPLTFLVASAETIALFELPDELQKFRLEGR